MSTTVLVPLGSYEAHGPILPPDTDTVIADYICRRVSERDPQIRLYPPINYGLSSEHLGFGETVTLTLQTYVALITEIVQGIGNCADVRLIVLLNGHGGNSAALSTVAAELNYRTSGARVIAPHVFGTQTRRLSNELFGTFDAHAGSCESSVMSYIQTNIPEGNYPQNDLGGAPTRKGLLALYPSHTISSNGIVSPLESIEISRSKGERILTEAVSELNAIISRTLDLIGNNTSQKLDSPTC